MNLILNIFKCILSFEIAIIFLKVQMSWVTFEHKYS